MLARYSINLIVRRFVQLSFVCSVLHSGAVAAGQAAVYGDFVNQIDTTGTNNGTVEERTTATFFGGFPDEYLHVDGSSEIVDSDDGTIRLKAVSFGQMVSRTVPYPNFEEATLKQACLDLFYDFENTCNGYEFSVEEIASAAPARDEAAFKYKVYMYGLDDENNVTALMENMTDHWGDAERNKALAVLEQVKSSLIYSPNHVGLRGTILDILYEIAVADFTLANEKYIEVAKARLKLPGYIPLPGELTISNEIALLEEAIPLYEDAIKPYYDLLIDPMGINTRRVSGNGNDNGVPFGYYLFREQVPGRTFVAGKFKNSEGELVPVLDEDGNSQPDEIYAGYKDLDYVYQVHRMLTRATADLVKLYVMRNETGQPSNDPSCEGLVDKEALFQSTETDVFKAKCLFQKQIQKAYTDGQLLSGIFSDEELEGVHSGLVEARRGWRQAVTQLDQLKPFIDGEANSLGLNAEFLALVDPNNIPQPASGPKDSFAFFEDLMSPGNPTGVLTDAVTKYETARASFETLRTYQDRIGDELTAQRRTYVDRLRSITGVQTIPDSPGFFDPTSPDYVGDEHPYANPENNQGSELYIQRQNINLAIQRIEKNSAQIENLQKSIEIEVQRRGEVSGINDAMAGTYIHYGNKQAGLTREIAEINAAQAAAAAAAQATSSYFSGPKGWVGSIAHGVNGVLQAAGELYKGKLQAKKERLAAQQSADIVHLQDDILVVESKARIKTLLLEMSTLAIESMETAISLAQEQGRLQALYDEKAHIEVEWSRARADLGTRYFADPSHRQITNDDLLDANFAFDRAQFWVFAMGRALDYKWNNQFLASGSLTDYTTETVFRLRNADELKDMVTAMVAYDSGQQLGNRGDGDFVTVSLRNDIFGYKITTGLERFPHAETGELVNAQAAFQSMLNISKSTEPVINLAQSYSEVIELRFSTMKTLTNFFEFGHWNERIDRLAVEIVYSGGAEPVNIWLEQAGTSYVRNKRYGVRDQSDPTRCVGEFTSYPTGYWNTQQDGSIQYNASFGHSFAVLVQDENDPRPGLDKFRDLFHELSPAVDEWVLQVPVKDRNDAQVYDISQITDIKIHFLNFWQSNREGANDPNVCI